MHFKLEVCVDSIESAVNAQSAGADRIELCNNLIEGGTTPSTGMISAARSNLDILLHVLIRPRGSDFLYSDIEYDIMRRDIEICGESGVDGVVFGILREDGNIDIEHTSRLIEMARPMSVTFHRAFDMCRDPFSGLEDVIATGADRLLSSGQKNKAVDGCGILALMTGRAGERIIIMPGSGINESNIEEIARSTGACEFHLTARSTVPSAMKYKKSCISMGGVSSVDEFNRKVANRDILINIIEILKLI
jgi:copper homeostasis protein